MHVPQPEVPADETNPKGFGESQWVVDLHARLLRRSNVRVADGRPQAWADTARVCADESVAEEVLGWLQEQFADDRHEVVLKDPRLAWFLGLWHGVAERSGAASSHVIMLRPPPEVVGSKQRYYAAHVGETSRIASWANQMLHAELATRGTDRAFIGYHELLDDWSTPVDRLGERFGLDAVRRATSRDRARVDELIDPGLRRVTITWDSLDIPKPLQAVTEEAWHQLSRLATPGLDNPETHAALDEVRREYVRLYEEAEALAQSSIGAAQRRRRKGKGRGQGKGKGRGKGKGD
ncbi:sulfotransferase family protein [Nocardioides donggukensis]|uniref:Sulfotransferase family protein n=1 Tax=Nocardioides donggukensis TaxID=2774019 RepID=A0A927K6I4_9ACTN|nr:sulfotransferase family protein [Nocardioides donggukensis]MBD8871114.1 sulfotransferase family protein [Nocardioides donggukensis]